jgi:pimeloyl-ACP methyl ester carboxylesterase
VAFGVPGASTMILRPNGNSFIQSRSGTLTGVDTVEYSPGRLTDLFGGDGDATVLMWHGMQSDARTALRPLAELVSNHGLNVVVPDWDSHAADGGRADLLASAQFAQQQADDALILVGWSLGGVAAAGLTIHAPDFGGRIHGQRSDLGNAADRGAVGR